MRLPREGEILGMVLGNVVLGWEGFSSIALALPLAGVAAAVAFVMAGKMVR